jgi:hypothetical protein
MRRFPVFPCLVALLAAGGAAAESGRLGNTLDVPVNYSAGTPDPAGGMQWTQHTIGPCEVQTWTWDLAEGQQGLGLGWPMWIDARKDGYGVVIGTGALLPLNADGSAIAAFFRYGDQVWLDSSANASTAMDACRGASSAAAPAPAPAPSDATAPAPTPTPTTAPPPTLSPAAVAWPEAEGYAAPPVDELAARLAVLVEKIARGEMLLVEVGGGYGRRGQVVAVPLPEFIGLLELQVISGDFEQTDAGALFNLAARHSKVLLVELEGRIAGLRKN